MLRADGYTIGRFSFARFLPDARQLYERVGVTGIPQPADFPKKPREIVCFMERQHYFFSARRTDTRRQGRFTSIQTRRWRDAVATISAPG
jgi:hypothetical protein